MRLALVIQIHEHVARASALLARKRKTARIQHSQIPAPLQIRLVGYVQTSQSARRDPVPHRSGAPSQPIRYKNDRGSEMRDIFQSKSPSRGPDGRKIIISQHHIDLAVRVLLLTPRRNHVLTSLGVTQMNEHVKRCFILDDFQQITIRR